MVASTNTETTESMFVFAGVATALLCSFSLANVSRRWGIPPVIAQLAGGVAIRMALRNAGMSGAAIGPIVQPLITVCLAAVGLVIGSHFTSESFHASGGRRMILFWAVLFPVLFGCVWAAAALLFPAHRHLAPLVAAIALERSSPEALAGILEAKAKGAFPSSTMLTAAVMDALALIAFVIAESFARASSHGDAGMDPGLAHLMRLILGTTCSVTLLVSLHGVFGNAVSPRFVALFFVAGLVLLHSYVEMELLLGAIAVGLYCGYSQPSPAIALIEAQSMPINLVLFSMTGVRIDAIHLVAHLPVFALVGLFAARLLGLWSGAFLGSAACGFPHPHKRGFALVTQLAVALSLVRRFEDHFPEAAPVVHGTLGMVLLGLSTGPSMLQLSLFRASEADREKAAPDDDRAKPLAALRREDSASGARPPTESPA